MSKMDVLMSFLNVSFCYRFHGKISREEAERLLVEDGCYLVRESQRALGQYTLSMK